MKAAIVAVLLLIAVAGCSKDKKITGPGPGPTYAVPSSPYSVLSNLTLAYSSRDTTEYPALFDASYTGTSADASPGGGVPLNFTKSDEMAHIRGLKRSASITRISLTFPQVIQRYNDLSDPPGWATIQMSNVAGEIDDNPTSYTFSADLMEFKFVPTTPAAGSPTDTTWKIIRWSEIRN